MAENTMDAIKKKMQAMRLEKETAFDRADQLEQRLVEQRYIYDKVCIVAFYTSRPSADKLRSRPSDFYPLNWKRTHRLFLAYRTFTSLIGVSTPAYFGVENFYGVDRRQNRRTATTKPAMRLFITHDTLVKTVINNITVINNM